MSSSDTFTCSNPKCKDYKKEQDSDYQSQDCPEYCISCVQDCIEKHLDNAFNPDDYNAKILTSEVIEEAYGFPSLVYHEVKIGKKKCEVSYSVDREGYHDVTFIHPVPEFEDDEEEEIEEAVIAYNRVK